jgi:hypothetical protein
MMETDGFLSSEILVSFQHMRHRLGEPPDCHKSNLAIECLSYDFNRLAMRVALFQYPLNSLSDFLASVLFSRVVQDYQAVILMAGRGMRAQSRTMTRTAIESMLHCLAASEDIQLKAGRPSPISYVDAVLSAHDSYRAKLSSVLLDSEALSVEVKVGLALLIDEIRGARPMSINLQQLAEDLGRSDWYSRHYRCFSQDSHPSVSSIEHHIFADDSGATASRRFGQNYEEFDDTVTVAIMALFEALRAIKNNQLPQELSESIEGEAVPLLERLAAFVSAS